MKFFKNKTVAIVIMAAAIMLSIGIGVMKAPAVDSQVSAGPPLNTTLDSDYFLQYIVDEANVLSAEAEVVDLAISLVAVKVADLRHNSDLSRMDESQIDEWALKRTEKYKMALKRQCITASLQSGTAKTDCVRTFNILIF